MKKIRSLYLCLSFAALLILPVSISAFDFSLVTNQYVGGGYEGGDENKFEYKASILPRLSFLIDEKSDFLLTAGVTLGAKDDEFYFLTELLRTEFTTRFGSSAIKAGRMYYAEPLSFIASGLFDGVQFSHNSAVGIFSVGAWYTGLLYKETANITMTANDMAVYIAALDYGDFANTYFAPKRLLASVDWEHPSIAELFSLKAAITGQIELSDADEKLHSQYLILKASVPVKRFLFELGGSLQIAQAVRDKTESSLAFAGNLGVFWTLPTSFHSRLSFTGNFAGGRVDDTVGAFVPVTTKVFGNVFQPKLSALSILELNYTARVNHAVGASLSASYFVRSDLGTFSGYPLTAESSDGYFLGTELFASVIWSPFSDLQLSLGGGAFFPSLGNVSDEKPQWRIKLNAIFAVY